MAYPGVNEGMLARIRAYIEENWAPEEPPFWEESIGHTMPAESVRPGGDTAHFEMFDMAPDDIFPEAGATGPVASEDYDFFEDLDAKPCLSEPAFDASPRPKPAPPVPSPLPEEPKEPKKAAKQKPAEKEKKSAGRHFKIGMGRKNAAPPNPFHASFPEDVAPHAEERPELMYSISAPAAHAAEWFDPQKGDFRLGESFPQAVLRLIDEKGMTDPQCYNRANLSRAVFNKLKQSALNPGGAEYRPSKETALALTMGLGLTLDEAKDLLEKAGFALSHCSKRDLIVEYFLMNGNHDIFELNEALFRFRQQPLGSF